jgi:hypothetical protein
VPDPRAERDALVAATAMVHGLTVVTRNAADFEPTGVALPNPWLLWPTERAFAANVPVLGLCYGEQTVAQQLGGQVEAGHHRGRFVSCRPEGDIGIVSSVLLVPVAVAAFSFK